MSTMTISAAPARAQGLRRYWRHGWRVLLYRSVLKVLARSRLERWVEFWIHQYIAVEPRHLRVPGRAPRGMQVEEITYKDVADLLPLRAGAEAEFLRRLQIGQHCFVARLKERSVAFVWAMVGPCELQSVFGCRWVVPAGTVWLYDLYSDPGVLGAMPYMNAMIRHRLRPGHLRWMAGQVDFDNHRSRQAHGSLGYEVRGSIWTLRVSRVCLHLIWRRNRTLPQILFGNTGIPLSGFHQARSAPQLERMGSLAEPGFDPSTQPPNSAPPGSASLDADVLWLQCPCGEQLPLTGDAWVCSRCGRDLGRRRDGISVFGHPLPYWGELPAEEMQQLLAAMERSDWRAAIRQFVPAALQEYILSPDRAAFQDLLPLPRNGRILEIGAGLGGISAELARRFRVVALEGVWERTRFMSLRGQQDGLNQLTVLNSDVNNIPFAPGQFDAIVVNGVLEWVAMADLRGDPQQIQLRFLERLRSLLTPGGFIYLAIENRFGWNELRGVADHSGLPYTSLMPRFLARWVCARSRRYRSAFNVGYRTYTYSYWGYRKLFARAGLDIRETYISPLGYNLPTRMIPLQQEAIAFAVRGTPSAQGTARIRQWVKRRLGQKWCWQLIGGDFAFVLQPHSENPRA